MPVIKSSHRKFTDNILYELLVYSEWRQEPDISKLGIQQQTTVGRIYGTVRALGHPLQYFKSNQSLAQDITRLKNYQLPWHFAVGEEGRFIAILQENQLEIRTSRDEYSSVIGKASLAKDVHQQWRRIVWSPDCSMLAVGASNGSVAFYDLLGSNLFNIPPVQDTQQWSCNDALAAILFVTTRVKSPKWLSELVIVDYGGRLRSFYVSPSEGCLEFHQTHLNTNGVSSVTWHPAHNLLIVSSVAEHTHPEFRKEGIGWGLSAWRLLNDHPYYRMAIPSPEQLAIAEGKLGFWNRLTLRGSNCQFSVVFKMQASPKGQFLACLHTCGTISIWQLPSLRLHRLWSLTEQPAYNIHNPLYKKKPTDLSTDIYLPLDLNWWSEQKIIISRKSGAVSVCNIDDLQNVLGESPEFLCGEPRLSTTCNEQGFLALECESQLMSVKRGQHGLETEENISSDEETSFTDKSSALVQSTVFMITDMERFQPKRKKAKILQRTYRLIGLKSTTPEELYNRKIDNEEYSEALTLAEAYNLDIDRVFQRQWRNSPVSVGSIYDYLSKVSKVSWVLHECCERVPETLNAAKELIKYGLKSTNIDVVFNAEEDVYKDITHSNGVPEDGVEKLSENEISVPINQLSEEAKIRISARKKLLQYSDILFVYEMILGGNEDNFDRDFYDRFRREPPILSAIKFARAGNEKAVELLLTYLGNETLPNWLTILNNFPETINPDNYRSLLPECTSEGNLFPWIQQEIRERDWCEKKHFRSIGESTDTEEDYKLPVPHEPLTPKVLEKWYLNRIYELELYSHMVDQALEMAKLARERNIKGLEAVHNELILLDVMVYDVGLEAITLSHLEKLKPLQKVQLLMSTSTLETFVDDIKNRLVPYLVRNDKLMPGSRQSLLKQFMLNLSEQDLSWALKFYESQPNSSIIQTERELVQLAVECVYKYKETDQFDMASAIFGCLPNKSIEECNDELKDLYTRVQEGNSELSVANILSHYNNAKTLEYIHNHRNDTSVVHNLLLKVARSTGNRIPPASDAVWSKLLTDMLEMQSKVFTCVSLDLCYEIYVSSVLASGRRPVIRTAVRILCCHSEDQSNKHLNLETSVRLVLQAAREYFDSAGSFTDKGIDLAKACLHLITEDNNEIQEELDLISSLQILDEFGISLLPMQVRICPDRFRFVDSCLHIRPTAYMETQKLLSLAHKLRIFGKDKRKREGVVLVRIANVAFEMKDYNFCADICYRLMDEEQSMGWEVAQQLGQCKEFPVLAKRQRLIAFALLHCPTDNLQELMDTRCELEYEILQLDIGEQVNKLNTSFEEDEFMDALTTPETPTREFLPQLTIKLQNTSNLLTRFATPDFWKDKFKFRNEPAEDRIIFDNSGMIKQGYPTFYASLYHNCHESQISPSYDTFNLIKSDVSEKDEWKQLRLTQALLQSALLEQEKVPQTSLSAMDDVIVQSSRLIFPEDCPLALSHLLSLSNPQSSKQCFSSLPGTLLSLQFAAYFYALSDAVSVNSEAIHWKPDQVLSWALQSEQKGECWELLESAMLQITNYEQGKKIEQLDCGVNIKRFTSDSQYKLDSILGLAMSEEMEKVEVAFDLAASHGVAEFEVVLSHISSLLLSKNFHLVMERIADNRFSLLLKEQPEIIFQRLKENVWPNIANTSYQVLIVYFSVLQCVNENKEVYGITPRDHIKLIKKVKATSSDIDYKMLVTQPQDLLSALRPAFSKDNITSIAKLLKALPNHIRSCLTVGQLYSDWITLTFKMQCIDAGSERLCLKQFHYLSGYFSKLSAEEILHVVCNTVFCHESAQQFDIETRQQMLTVVQEFCQNQNNNKEWADLSTALQRMENHLLQISSLQSSFPTEVLPVLIQLDTACEDEEKMLHVLDIAIMTIAISFSCLQGMIKLLPSQQSISTLITRLLKSPHLTSSKKANILLTRVEECVNNGAISDEWCNLLEPLAKSSHLDSQVRLKAVQLLQKLEYSYNDEVESCRLVSEAILSCPVEAAKVCDVASRTNFFNQLLHNTHSWEELSVLHQLLTAWPHTENNLYLDLVKSMFRFKSDQFIPTLKLIFNQVEFSEEALQEFIIKVEDEEDTFAVITICLLVKFESLHQKAVALFAILPETVNIPSNISRLLVEVGLTANMIGCPLYQQFVEQLLDEDHQLCQSAVDQLLSAGHLAEAGTLFLMYSAVPLALRTFSTAVNVISRQS